MNFYDSIFGNGLFREDTKRISNEGKHWVSPKLKTYALEGINQQSEHTTHRMG